MKDTALYEQLLGLKSPWSVRQVDLSLTDQRVVVEVVLKKGQVWADPTDATKRAHVNGWTERHWRHLDTCQFETLIKARVPQLKYSDGTVEELVVPWAERYSRVTTMMTGFVIKLLEACPTTQAVCTLNLRAVRQIGLYRHFRKTPPRSTESVRNMVRRPMATQPAKKKGLQVLDL